MNELQEYIESKSIQRYRLELKEYINTTYKEPDPIKYLIYKLHIFKRANPSILLGSIRHTYASIEEAMTDVQYAVNRELITWNQEREEFITKLDDNYDGYGYVLPDVTYQSKHRDDVQELLYNTTFELNQYVTDNFIETKNTYKKYNSICKKAYSLLGSNELRIDYKYDYRGRMYAKGFYINPLGTSYNKACIQSTKDIPIEGEI